MLEQLRAWLNGKKDYAIGVKLYCQLGDNVLLKKLLLKEKTDYNIKRLHEELLDICKNLKSQHIPKQSTQPDHAPTPVPTVEKKPIDTIHTINQEEQSTENVELHKACLAEANKIYKQCMNDRAILFKMVPGDMYQDPNGPNEQLFRSDLAIKVVKLYKEASELYDRADYVKKHGQLPPNEAIERSFDINAIPDVLVYQELDLRRKTLNKHKKKEQTAERVAIIQQIQSEIQQLENKWQLLKQAR